MRMRKSRICSLLIYTFLATVILFITIQSAGWSSQTGLCGAEKLDENLTNCHELLITLNKHLNGFNRNVLLYDGEVLKELEEKKCSLDRKRLVKIGISHQDAELNISIIDSDIFDVTVYKNRKEQDFLDFDGLEARRIIPKDFEIVVYGKIVIPKDKKIFSEYWKRSKVVDCLGLKVRRNESEPRVLNLTKAIETLSTARKEMSSYGMFPFLSFGSLLGWYRECSIIPHTTDLDTFVYIEELNSKYLDYMKTKSSMFTLARKLGKVTDGLEWSIYHKKYPIYIDVFFMFTEKRANGTKYYYVGGLDGNLNKFKFEYEYYDPYCSGIMHNRLFWVSCTPLHIVKVEYGDYFYTDHHTRDFAWYGNPNMRKDGKFHESEKAEVIQYF